MFYSTKCTAVANLPHFCLHVQNKKSHLKLIFLITFKKKKQNGNCLCPPPGSGSKAPLSSVLGVSALAGTWKWLKAFIKRVACISDMHTDLRLSAVLSHTCENNLRHEKMGMLVGFFPIALKGYTNSFQMDGFQRDPDTVREIMKYSNNAMLHIINRFLSCRPSAKQWNNIFTLDSKHRLDVLTKPLSYSRSIQKPLLLVIFLHFTFNATLKNRKTTTKIQYQNRLLPRSYWKPL